MTARYARLQHVQIAAPPGSELAARAFFVDLLGMTEVPKPPNLAKRGGIWLDLDGSQLHVGIDPAFRPAEKAHPAFEVDDLDALRRRLTDRGVATWEDEVYPGRRRFYARDPWGNRLEFLSRPGE
ncbi:MAG TPA: VOC family protein [Thermoplasmata archaeon]|nr:VOC family protein [Thermoplasmata archaeon]